MSIPYFPMYPADFEADTSHLSLEEDGAYNRLLRLMWMTPGCSLPDDDMWIARRMRCDMATYTRVIAPLIVEFFRKEFGRIFSPRLMREFEKAEETYKKRSDAGKRGGRPRSVENKGKTEKPGFAFDKGGPKQPEPEPEPSTASAVVAQPDAVPADQTDRERLLEAMGADPISGISGPNGKRLGTMTDMAEADKWTALGISNADQCRLIAERIAACRSKDACFTPRSFAYFTGAMADFAARRSAPVPSGSPNTTAESMDAKRAKWRKIAGAA